MERKEYDVVCIGGGGAGVSAAIRASQLGAKVALISKEPVGYGNTRLAAGAMSCTGMKDDDGVERFIADLLKGGDQINNRRLVEVVAGEAPLAATTMEDYGYIFRRNPEGQVTGETAKRTGGHSIARTIGRFAGGLSLGQVLRAASARGQIDVYEDMFASRLLKVDGRVTGVVALHLTDGEVFAFACKSLIIATGGAGWLFYPHTDCLKPSTGDGFALALRAGAELIDMEQVQFLPFALNHPMAMVGLAVGEPFSAGDHGKLVNAKGDVVLTKINVMTRAQVANVIALEVKKGNGTENGGLLLDLSDNLTADGQVTWEFVFKNLPFTTVRKAYGEKAFRWEEPWDVTPTVHFTMGGVRIDEHGRSTVEGLYAAGEASGGLHGGNRLGSVALTEIFVFGLRAGEKAAKDAAKRSLVLDEGQAEDEAKRLEALYGAKGKYRPTPLVRRLQATMWENVGVVRDAAGLDQALREIAEIEGLAADLQIPEARGYNPAVADAIELKLMLDVARVTALSARQREESRGAHVRADFPQKDDEKWLKNIVVSEEPSAISGQQSGAGRGLVVRLEECM